MSFLHTLVSFVIALGILIVAHEFGHYLVARWCGIKVLRFSVGFGRPLATWRIGRDRTEWVIAAVPFGGYVKMLDEREGPVEERERRRAFNRQGVGRRFLVVVAGPVFNFLFAIALYAGLFMYGLPEARPVLAAPAAGTMAQAAGFRSGDTVVSVNGESVSTWQDLRWRVLQAALQRDALRIDVLDERQHLETRRLDLSGESEDDFDGDAMERLGLRLFRPPLAPVFGKLLPGGAAERDGLITGDRVTAVDGKAVETWENVVEAVRRSPGKEMRFAVQRQGASLEVRVVPDAVAEREQRIGRIGAAPDVPATQMDRILVRVRYDPLESLAKAAVKTADIARFSLRILGKMLLGEVSWRHLSGPVTIADFAGQSAQAGWISYLLFLALISVSLGVLNLLPIPLLDGGHLMYYAIEIIKGSPVSERAVELGQRVGLALLLVMMAFAFYNDLNRLLSG